MADLSGSTATVLLVQDDYLAVANAGDSPAIIFRYKDGKLEGEQISTDHKPELEEESKRIISCDGVLE